MIRIKGIHHNAYRCRDSEGIESRGVSDHGFIHSIYFRDPNGYVVELTTKLANHDDTTDPSKNHAREILDRWQTRKNANP